MKKIISTNPGRNYEIVGEVEVTPNSDIRQKVKDANDAKEDWRRLGVVKRAAILRKAYQAFQKRAGDIAEIITKEIGAPITECREEVAWDWGYFEWFLDHAEHYLAPEIIHEDKSEIFKQIYEPLGTVAVITPWNLPFDLFLWGVIPNLLVGNTVVYKASSQCALSGKLFGEIMDSAGLPKGVFSAIHGASVQGEYLTSQAVDLIWFTGSSEVGKHLYELAGRKFIKAVMEMGGSNPAIVFADADLDLMTDKIMFKRYAYTGQTCDAVKRLIVHKEVFTQVVDRLKARVAKIVIGDPQDPKTQMGPLTSKKQLEKLIKQVNTSVKMGAKVIIGARQPEYLKGAYYLPTILTGITGKMPVWKEEVFGPVLPIVQFESEEEAIKLANDTPYGLSAQVYTKDMKLAQKMAGELKAGSVDINGINHFRPFVPFGGYKESGMGKEHGKLGFHDLCRIKVISQ
ncbi:aldehyde dehydrogenase family protein [Candidatus Microgenomates bacterium]|nr:aldehyde dehydrogenase family protein [Candidatus Microgenomates bacterium]